VRKGRQTLPPCCYNPRIGNALKATNSRMTCGYQSCRLREPAARLAGIRRSVELIPKEGSPLGSDITYPETRQPGRPLGTTRHIRGPRPDAALTIVSVNRIAINRGGALKGGIRLLHNQKRLSFRPRPRRPVA